MDRHNLADFAIGWAIIIACIPNFVFALSYAQPLKDESIVPLSDPRAQQVTEAAPFAIGPFSVAGGWKVTHDRGGGIQADGVAVRNTDAKSRRAFFTIILLNHEALVDTITCYTKVIRPSHVEAADCADASGGGVPRDFDRIGVEPTF
jgi:hypothetical protein